MEELRRIFCDRKILVMFLCLWIVNGWFTYQAMQPDKELQQHYQENYAGDYVADEQDVYLEYLEQYRQLNIEEAEAELEVYWADFWEQMNNMTEDELQDTMLTQEDLEQSAMSEIQMQVQYLTGYDSYLTDIRRNAEDMKQISVLGENGSFSQRNIDKTVKDFEGLEDVLLSLDNERAVNAYIQNDITEYILLLFPMIFVLQFMEERKRGLWQFVHAMPGGRGRLAAKRCGILLLGIVVAGGLLELQSLGIIGVVKGGFGDLARAVQSNMNFERCTILWNMGQFLFCAMLTKILVSYLFGLVFWVISTMLENQKIAMVLMVVFVALEYYAYTDIGAQDTLNQFKYINLFAFLDSPVLLTQYRNLNIFGNPVNVMEILAVLIPVLLGVFAGFSVLTGYRKPFSPKSGMWQKVWNQLIGFIKPYRHGSVFLHECYKVFIQQKAAWILIVLGIIGWYLSKPETMYFDYKTNIYNGYMEQIQGELLTDKVTYLEAESVIWKKKIQASEKKVSKYEALVGGDAEYGREVFQNQQEYEQEIRKIQKYYEALEVVDELCSESERLSELSEAGIDVGFVNKTGYRMYIGHGGSELLERNILIGMIFLMLSLAGAWCYETSQNAGMFLRSAIHGRSRLFHAKCLVCTLVSLVIQTCIGISEYTYIKGTYGLAQQELSVYSLEMFAEFPWDISIRNMLMLIWILRFVMLSCLAMLVLLVSKQSKNVLVSMVICFGVLIVPGLLVYIGFEEIAIVSVFRTLQVTYFWNLYGFEGIYWMLPLLIFVGIGTGAWIWQRKRA